MINLILKMGHDLMSWMILFDSTFDSRFHVGNGRVMNDGTWRMSRFLIGDLDEMVQQHLRSLSKKGSEINTTVANATARALIIKYPHVAGDVDVESSRWAKSLFARMNFDRRR